jgi:hypothetical protein
VIRPDGGGIDSRVSLRTALASSRRARLSKNRKGAELKWILREVVGFLAARLQINRKQVLDVLRNLRIYRWQEEPT